ncbi:MAG: PhzF family phenazine biosynthesis protein [Candidatus Thorarchaeota archaeon]|nr:PhzF family phenazine biosynthesis protein [Candidatus Thorarchaeota archaeon]
MKKQRELKVIQVDVFTDTAYGGNPAVVIPRADNLSTELMHKIASEMNARETVFVKPSKVADFRFHYWTPKSEIAFSGHPTIAAFHALIEEGLIDVVKEVNMVSLETKAGVLAIEIVKNDSTGIHEIQITHGEPQFSETYDPKIYAEALGLTLADILSPNPVQTVSTGIPHLVIPLSTMRSMERIRPNWDRLEDLQKESDYISIQVFTRDTKEVTSDAHARHFAPGLGVNEDPASGSGAAATGSYMIRYGLMEPTIPVTSIVIEQGHFMKRPGKIFVEVQGDAERIRQVKVSGTGVTVMRGYLLI